MMIAIDFGGTNIKIGLVHEGRIVARSILPSYSEKGILARLPAAQHEIMSLLNKQQLSLTDCVGIGIATPGIVDSNHKTILSINDKFDDAVDFDFQTWAKDSFSLPLVMENDARAALLGEIHYGSAQGVQDAVLLTFGTGIGTAAIINGQMVRGKHFQAGILGGHLSTDIHGNPCNCGNDGCLEAQAGHWSLSYAVKHHSDYSQSKLAAISNLGYSDIIEIAQKGDQVAIDVLNELIAHWSAGIVNMIHAYDPEIVILSGGLMKSKHLLVPILAEKVKKMSWTPWGEVNMVVAEDPDVSVLLGLSSLCYN